MAEIVEEAIPFPEAFARRDAAARQSQAASLLLLAKQLEVGPRTPPTPAAALEVSEAAEEQGGGIPPEAAELAVPVLRGVDERPTPTVLREALRDELGPQAAALIGVPGEPSALAEGVSRETARLARRVEEEPTTLWAAALSEACLFDPDPLVRVAAAYADLQATVEPDRALATLVAGTYEVDPLVRDVAATALARYDPIHPRLAELREAGAGAPGSEPSHTALLVHGTWARGNEWWQPGGTFHRYLRSDVRPDLYSDTDRFDWSGGYSDHARARAAEGLIEWVRTRGLEGLDVFCHSHGASTAMLASQAGLDLGTLVALSCPVHRPKYWPGFTHVRRVISIRVKLDLVILVDGGGQRFRDPRIEENVLPIWFNHSATHDPDVWRDHEVPSLLE